MKLKSTNPLPLVVGGGCKISNDRRRFLICGVDKVVNGVFMQDTSGNLWTISNVHSGITPNGVAIITDVCSFVVSLSEGPYLPLDDSGGAVNVPLPSHSVSEADEDYDGVNNTEVLSSIGGGDSEATGYCKNFIFPNGNHGYLGSAGEWKILWNYKEDINKLLLCFNGSDEIGDGYGTSTKHTEGEGLEDMDGNIISTEHYFYRIAFGELISQRTTYDRVSVRPFTTLNTTLN